MRTKIGDEAANKLCNEAVYFIGIGTHSHHQSPKNNHASMNTNFSLSGSNDYVNNFLQPFLADGQQFTHDEFLEFLISTLGEQFMVIHTRLVPNQI